MTDVIPLRVCDQGDFRALRTDLINKLKGKNDTINFVIDGATPQDGVIYGNKTKVAMLKITMFVENPKHERTATTTFLMNEGFFMPLILGVPGLVDGGTDPEMIRHDNSVSKFLTQENSQIRISVKKPAALTLQKLGGYPEYDAKTNSKERIRDQEEIVRSCGWLSLPSTNQTRWMDKREKIKLGPDQVNSYIFNTKTGEQRPIEDIMKGTYLQFGQKTRSAPKKLTA